MPTPFRSNEARLATLLILGFAGCASTGTSQYRPMAADFRETGTFRFVAQTTDGVQGEGWVNVTADTIIVRGTPGPCYYERDSRMRGGIIYRCSDRFIAFDRRRPVTRAYLSYPKQVKVTQRVCADYGTNSAGARVCTRYEMETTYRSVYVSIRLNPITE
jgi:hypothetical protein